MLNYVACLRCGVPAGKSVSLALALLSSSLFFLKVDVNYVDLRFPFFLANDFFRKTLEGKRRIGRELIDYVEVCSVAP